MTNAAIAPNSALHAFGDIELEVTERGTGRPVVVLHGAAGPSATSALLDRLEPLGRLIVPSHPGFGRSNFPEWIRSVDDLAYLYLDLLDRLDLRDVALIGFGMGGWAACEVAVKCAHRLATLVLVGPVGIRVGGRETRDIPDIFALSHEQITARTYHDPRLAPNLLAASDDELLVIAKQREATAIYLWEPYMHDPQLRRRLGRIAVPTLLLRGESDGIVSDDYARAYAAAIPGARYETIPNAGHLPQREQPDVLASRIARFLAAEE